MITRRARTVTAVAILVVLTASCADDTADAGSTSTSEADAATSVVDAGTTTATTAVPSTTLPVPGGEWSTSDAATAGLDPEALEDIAATARDRKSNCLLVTRSGRISGEWYFAGTTADTTQNVFSVSKSVTSTLVGIAQADGHLDIGQPASTWITEWKGTPSEAVTVRDLLSNVSGRRWSIAIDYLQLIKAPDKTAFAVGLGQDAAPGEVWAYNNSAIQTLERVLESATGTDVATFAQERLFGPLGMTRTRMSRDAAGNTQLFQGVQSTCRDLARFGTLFLNRGAWGDRQIVPSAWVDEATGQSSQALNEAYGYLWWLNRSGTIGSPLVASGVAGAGSEPGTKVGQIATGAPEGLFWAIGLGNQIVQVDPGSRTVVVRLGTAELRPAPPTFDPVEASRVVTEAVTGPPP